MNRSEFLGLALVMSLSFASASHGAEKEHNKTIVIKADDVTSVAPKWQKFFEVSKAEGVKVTAGLIGNSFNRGGQGYADWLLGWEANGDVEFWHHGWDHKRWEKDSKSFSEFGGSGYPHQKKHLDSTQRDARQWLKKSFTTFGSPFNALDEDTVQALNEFPELKRIFVYPDRPLLSNFDKSKILLPMHLVGELDGVGKPNFEKFKEDYSKRIAKGFTLSALQFHPGLFDEARLAEYVKILKFLKEEGWKFALAKEIESPNHRESLGL